MQRKIYLEWMRLLAASLVIFNHLPGYTLYGISSGSKQAFYMVLTMITRINVPLFFMISGILLFSKEEDFLKVIKKRVSRFCLIIIIFEGGLFCACLVKSFLEGSLIEYPLRKFVFGVLAGNLDWTGAYWYLYAYLGLLFTLPFMQRIAKRIEKQDFIVLLMLHFFFRSLIPLLNIGLNKIDWGGVSISSSFSVPLATTKAFFFPLIGYYIDRNIEIGKLQKKHIVGLVIGGVVGILLSCFCTYYEGITTGKYTQNYVQLFDYLTTIVVFILIKYVTTRKYKKLSEGNVAKMVCVAGSLTFGIYLFDPYLKFFMYDKYENFAEPVLPTLIVSIGWVFISMCLGGLITFFLKKMPLFRKIL